MKIFHCGFNLYGQFTQCQDPVIKTFVQASYEEFQNLELCHSFNITFNEQVLILTGFNNGLTHQKQSIQIQNLDPIKQLACGDDKIILLTSKGQLFKGDLPSGQSSQPTFSLLTNLLSSEDGDKFAKISSKKKLHVALTEQGKVFSLPNKLKFENRNIVDVSTGCEHCLLLEKNGDVYSFGRGSRGQLGHGNLQDKDEPRLVEALAGIKMAKIACGGWHSCAVSCEGDLYTWGWNGNGQLGLGENEQIAVMATPHVVDLSDSESNVINVSCGYRHTIALADNGKLYATGWNKYQQLGNLKNENIYNLSSVHDFTNFEVLDLKCGPWSSVVVVK